MAAALLIQLLQLPTVSCHPHLLRFPLRSTRFLNMSCLTELPFTEIFRSANRLVNLLDEHQNVFVDIGITMEVPKDQWMPVNFKPNADFKPVSGLSFISKRSQRNR